MPKLPKEKLKPERYGLTLESREPEGVRRITHPGVVNAWEWYNEYYDRVRGKKKWHLNLMIDKISARYSYLLRYNISNRLDFKLMEGIRKYRDFAKAEGRGY